MTEPNTSDPRRGGRLAGKVCGITGATGIAEAAALRFAAEGARLFVVDSARRMPRLAERLGADVEITWVAADLTDEGDTERAFARCSETFGRLDALLACAGGSGRPFGDGPLHSTSLESWNTTVALNLNTAFLSSRGGAHHARPTDRRLGGVHLVRRRDQPGRRRVQHARLLRCQGRDQLADHQRRLSIRRRGHPLQRDPAGTDADSDVEEGRIGSHTLDIVKARMPVSGGGPLSADDHAQAALVPVQRRVEAHHRPTDSRRRRMGRQLARNDWVLPVGQGTVFQLGTPGKDCSTSPEDVRTSTIQPTLSSHTMEPSAARARLRIGQKRRRRRTSPLSNHIVRRSPQNPRRLSAIASPFVLRTRRPRSSIRSWWIKPEYVPGQRIHLVAFRQLRLAVRHSTERRADRGNNQLIFTTSSRAKS